MAGKIPNNYEESKQWIDVYNGSDKDPILAFCPCLINRSPTLTSNTPKGLFDMLAEPLSKFERVPGETAGFFNDSFTGNKIAVCGPVDIPPGGFGKVSIDWPLIAKVDAEDLRISDIVVRPVFPNSIGFMSFKTRFSEAQYYWRRQQSFLVLKYPAAVKSGLCWVSQEIAGDETPLRLLSFTVKALTSVSAGFSELQLIPDQQSDDSVVSLKGNTFEFYSLGRYDMYLNFQFTGKGEIAPSITVPSGSFALVGDFEPTEDLPAERGSAYMVGIANNRISFVRSAAANIDSIQHGGGNYDCSNVEMTFVNPSEHFHWFRDFAIHAKPKVGLDVLKGALGRTLVAKLKMYASWASAAGQTLDIDLNSGHGYLALRSETTII